MMNPEIKYTFNRINCISYDINIRSNYVFHNRCLEISSFFAISVLSIATALTSIFNDRLIGD